MRVVYLAGAVKKNLKMTRFLFKNHLLWLNNYVVSDEKFVQRYLIYYRGLLLLSRLKLELFVSRQVIHGMHITNHIQIIENSNQPVLKKHPHYYMFLNKNWRISFLVRSYSATLSILTRKRNTWVSPKINDKCETKIMLKNACKTRWRIPRSRRSVPTRNLETW